MTLSKHDLLASSCSIDVTMGAQFDFVSDCTVNPDTKSGLHAFEEAGVVTLTHAKVCNNVIRSHGIDQIEIIDTLLSELSSVIDARV